MATNKDPSFSIFEFRYWLAKQPDFDCSRHTKVPQKVRNECVNTKIESRLGPERLRKQIAAHNPDMSDQDVDKCARIFKEHGGSVKEVDDLNLIVELGESTFAIPRAYTKPQ